MPCFRCLWSILRFCMMWDNAQQRGECRRPLNLVPVAIMAPNFSKLVSKFWKRVSKRKYALTSRKYALTSRNYALTPRKYALTSRKDFGRMLLRDFWTILRFVAHPPHWGFTVILTLDAQHGEGQPFASLIFTTISDLQWFYMRHVSYLNKPFPESLQGAVPGKSALTEFSWVPLNGLAASRAISRQLLRNIVGRKVYLLLLVYVWYGV